MPKLGNDEDSSGHIRTFLRIRPSMRPSGFINVDEFDKTRLDFHVPVEHRDGEVGGRRQRKNYQNQAARLCPCLYPTTRVSILTVALLYP